MSANESFDIHGFAAEQLDMPVMLGFADAAHPDQAHDWTRTLISQTPARTVYRLDPADSANFPSLTLKIFHDNLSGAEREFQMMTALEEFGISLAPRPFYHGDGVLVCEWIHGDPITTPPAPTDDEGWHRIMAAMGVSKNLAFGKYASMVPMQGTGIQHPADVFNWLDDHLAQLGEAHPDYATLAALVATAQDTIEPQWATMPKIGLSRLNPDYGHYIWDGHHLRAISWWQSDWSDVAFDLAQMAADPLYLNVPAGHWVWFRWEYARLTHDEHVIARATTYTHLLNLDWAIRLSQTSDHLSKKRQMWRDHYLKLATKTFGTSG